ncbi:MAG: hypothetical protein AB8W36_02435 [Coxiella endosymbiont of Dermacentor nuttalli]
MKIMLNVLRQLWRDIIPVISMVFFVILFIIGILLFSYLLIIGAVIILILFIIAFIQLKVAQQKRQKQKKPLSSGRTIEYGNNF